MKIYRKDLEISKWQEVGVTIIHTPTKTKVSTEMKATEKANFKHALKVLNKMLNPKGTLDKAYSPWINTVNDIILNYEEKLFCGLV